MSWSCTDPKPGARKLLQIQGFQLSYTAVSGHKQGAGWADSGAAGLEAEIIYDSGVFKARTLATRPTGRVRSVFYKVKRTNGKKNTIIKKSLRFC